MTQLEPSLSNLPTQNGAPPEERPTEYDQAPLSGTAVPVKQGRRLPIPAFVRLLLQNPKAKFGLALFAFIALASIIGPMFTHGAPNANLEDFTLRSQPPSWAHPFGTTDQAQDVFKQVLYGGRISLLVGALASGIATLVALTVGLLAAYRPGLIDDSINMVTNIFLVIPGLPLLIVLATFLPYRGAAMLVPVIGLTSWAGEARILRGQALGLRGRDFILAAKVAGESTWRIVFGEFVPNMISRIAAGFIFTFVGAIFFEAALEFLGFGDASQVSWGTELYWAGNSSATLSGEWWLFVFPGCAIALTVTGLVFLNYGVDELSNPRLRKLKGAEKVGLVERTLNLLSRRGPSGGRV
ncbi:MAG: peptide/nickel transport system permease protein [Gaiellaceae bacterium]|jgi:peptide/nickel transport system permease protein|nr:peptide/nickel transport system permease protein [Gaiellaceae bacterium]